MSLDTVTRSLKRKLNSGPPSPGSLGRKALWGDEGSQPLPSSDSGENPRLFAIPPPPTPESLVLESEGNEECGKYLKAVASAREVAGGHMGGSRAALFPETVQKCSRWGSRPSGVHEARAEACGAGGVGPGGDHGFTLHSGQSFQGTPELPGNRTGTRPPSAPWLVSGSAASSLSGRCPPRLRTASAPGRC